MNFEAPPYDPSRTTANLAAQGADTAGFQVERLDLGEAPPKGAALRPARARLFHRLDQVGTRPQPADLLDEPRHVPGLNCEVAAYHLRGGSRPVPGQGGERDHGPRGAQSLQDGDTGPVGDH